MIGSFSRSAELLLLERGKFKYVLGPNGNFEQISDDFAFGLEFYQDWKPLEAESEPRLIEIFRMEAAKARLLGLTQSLEKRLPDAVLRVVINDMEQLLESNSIREWAINQMFASPSEIEPGFIRPIVIARERSSVNVVSFLESIYRDRFTIQQLTNRWQVLPTEVWSHGPLKATELWCHLVESCILFRLLCAMRVQEFTASGDGKLIVKRVRVTGRHKFLAVWNTIPFSNEEESIHSQAIGEALADHLFVDTQITRIEDSSGNVTDQIETSVEG